MNWRSKKFEWGRKEILKEKLWEIFPLLESDHKNEDIDSLFEEYLNEIEPLIEEEIQWNSLRAATYEVVNELFRTDPEFRSFAIDHIQRDIRQDRDAGLLPELYKIVMLNVEKGELLRLLIDNYFEKINEIYSDDIRNYLSERVQKEYKAKMFQGLKDDKLINKKIRQEYIEYRVREMREENDHEIDNEIYQIYRSRVMRQLEENRSLNEEILKEHKKLVASKMFD